MLTYNLKPINLEADSVEELAIPNINDRIIEMHGQVREITMQGIADMQLERQKKIKELNTKAQQEQAKMDNIEEHHPFINDISEEQLAISWLYYQSKVLVDECGKKAQELQDWYDEEAEQVDEIKKQIKEFN
jgi:hypothetical protein